MNMHTKPSTDSAGCYGAASLEDLATRFASLVDMTVGKNWPDDDMDKLVDLGGNLRREIVRRADAEGSALAAYVRAREAWGG
ncbi:MAG: hypothetical protein JJ911_07780 [Rhizobiaceae bacterium]|nr:hypothetical protein [Rhizobiaceae bacterium]